jgi:phosphoglycolate phosphatase
MTVVHAGGVAFDVDAVAFDKDGTLIDLDATWGPLAAAWVHGVAGGDAVLAASAAHHLGLDLSGPRLVPDSIFAAGTIDQIRTETALLLASHGHVADDVERAVQLAAESVMALGPVAPVPLADLPTLFGRLTDAGAPCAIVTSDDRASTVHLVSELGISTLVAAIVGGDETPRPKPFPDALELAAERLGVATRRLLMVGDSLTDQGAARSAGCPFVAVGRGTAAAGDCDAVIDHVGQIQLG